MTRAALDQGYHVVLEGILHTSSYREPLRQLIAGHPGPTSVFWMQVSLAETIRRHYTRAEPIPVTADDMAGWYSPLDLLGTPGEHVIDETSGLDQTVSTILHRSNLAQTAARTPCPTQCPRCAEKHEAPTPGGPRSGSDRLDRQQSKHPGQLRPARYQRVTPTNRHERTYLRQMRAPP